MKNILVTGSSGQLGYELQGLSYTHSYKGYKFFHTSRKDLDITDHEQVKRFFSDNRIDCILNCAAYTNVDKAETEEEQAMLVNGQAVEWLVKAAEENNSHIFHISTDYVFNGRNYLPYKEEDPVNPDSVYGKTKLMGEEAVLQYKNGTVIRTSWLYSHQGKNFLTSILNLANERDELNVVYDQVGTPTYARDLARVLLNIAGIVLENGNTFKSGLYHFSNEGVCSWYDFALEIVRITGKHCKINPIESFQYPTPASRPHYSVLNKSRIKSSLSITIPHWKESLVNCIDQLD